MWIKDAHAIATQLVESMRPSCERVEVAGSVRRGCQEVKDIEIVAVPRWEESSLGMFADGGQRLNRLLAWASEAEARGELTWIKPGTREVIPWEPRRDGKYWRALLLPSRVKLDLFLPRPDNFGLIYLIRTGHKYFSAAVLGHARWNTPYQTESSYFEEHALKGSPEAYLVESATGRRVETREERDVFRLLELKYVEPCRRTDARALVTSGRASGVARRGVCDG